MFQPTPFHLCLGISLAWPLFWALIFDRWFFWTPLGLFVALGLPIIGWLIWWKFYEGNEEKLLTESKLVLAKSTIALNRIKKQIAEKRASN